MEEDDSSAVVDTARLGCSLVVDSLKDMVECSEHWECEDDWYSASLVVNMFGRLVVEDIVNHQPQTALFAGLPHRETAGCVADLEWCKNRWNQIVESNACRSERCTFHHR